MKIFKSYKNGILEAALRPKLILILWLVNLIFSFFIYFQVSGLITREVAPHVEAGALLKKMDFNVLFDLLTYHGEVLRVIIKSAVFIGIIYFILSFFIYGGILLSLRYPRKNKTDALHKPALMPLFFHGAGRYFFRFFILWVYSLILWVIFILINILLTPAGNLLTRNGENEPMLLPVVICRIVIGIFLILLIKMIMDYARIHIVLEDSRRIFRSLITSAGFVFRRFGRVLSLFYLILVTGIIFSIILWLVRSIIPGHTVAGIFAAFILGQAVIYSRCWTTVAFQASQLNYYKSIKNYE